MKRFCPAGLASPLMVIGMLMMIITLATSAPAQAETRNASIKTSSLDAAPSTTLSAAPDEELPPYRGNLSQYFIDRGNDFLDILRIRFGIPHKAHAFGLKARVTCLAQIGFVWFEGEQYGLDRRAVGQWHEGRTEGGVSVLYGSNVQTEPGWGNRFLRASESWTAFQSRGIVRNNLYWDDGRHHPLSIGAEVQTGILPGIDLGLYPGEALDFVMGIFTVDFWDDDGLHVNRNLRRLAKIRSGAMGEPADGTAAPEMGMSVVTAPSPEVHWQQIDVPPAPYADGVLPEVIDATKAEPILFMPPQPEMTPAVPVEPETPVTDESEADTTPTEEMESPEPEAAPAPAPEAAVVPAPAPKARPTEVTRTRLQEMAKPEAEAEVAAPAEPEALPAEPVTPAPVPEASEESSEDAGETVGEEQEEAEATPAPEADTEGEEKDADTGEETTN